MKRCSQECEHGTQSACATGRLQRSDHGPAGPPKVMKKRLAGGSACSTWTKPWGRRFRLPTRDTHAPLRSRFGKSLLPGPDRQG